MNIFDTLQSVLSGSRESAGSGAGVATAPGGGGLAGMINSGQLGNIAQTILSNKKGGISWLKGALLAGAGSMLWSRLTKRMDEANAAEPRYQAAASSQATPDAKAERIVRALIYAAKSDGHIDEQEKAAINKQLNSMDLGPEGKALVRQAMNEPLDPTRVARGVTDSQEALQLYALSSAVVNPDEFMEQQYLSGLAKALGVPDDVRNKVDMQLHTSTMP